MRPSVAFRLASIVVVAALSSGGLSSCAFVRGAHAATAVGRPVTTPGAPTVQPVAPDPRIGAVFAGDPTMHACTGSVLDSSSGDLILTAAHCLAGTVDATFVPGFDDTVASGGAWHVDAVFMDPRWVATQDPHADFAVARVSRADGMAIETVAGSGLRPVPAPAPGSPVTVTGYSTGAGGGPLSCRVPTSSSEQGFPAVRCGGMVAGFSGAPWVSGSTVSGVIGGLDGGGCIDVVSYSSPFDGAVPALMNRAEAGGPGDDAPTVFDDGCG